MISKIIAEELIHKVKREIEDAKKIVMVTHFGPDGDAMGASLGMWHFLMALEKEPKVILPTPPPDFLMWMPGAEQSLIYVFQKEEADKIIKAAN